VTLKSRDVAGTFLLHFARAALQMSCPRTAVHCTAKSFKELHCARAALQNFQKAQRL